MKLAQHTLLRCTDTPLELRVESNNVVQVITPAGSMETGPHTLAILDAFAQPRTLGAALGLLRGPIAGFQEWIDLTNTLAQLYQAGILRDESSTFPASDASEFGYFATPAEVKLLNNRPMVDGMLHGIREQVKSGDVVVNINAGTGIFAIAAAQAGARHVYAIESGTLGETTRAMIAASDVAGRITLLESADELARLPERADALIDETLISYPHGEYGLRAFAQVRARYLKPAAALIPARVQIFGLPLSLPADVLSKHTFMPATIANWRAWYGTDFTPFVDVASLVNHLFHASTADVHGWKAIAAPVQLGEIDLSTDKSWIIDSSVPAAATASGQLNAVLLYFSFQFGPGTGVASYGAGSPPEAGGKHQIWILGRQPWLKHGETFRLGYRRHIAGKDTALVASGGADYDDSIAAQAEDNEL